MSHIANNYLRLINSLHRVNYTGFTLDLGNYKYHNYVRHSTHRLISAGWSNELLELELGTDNDDSEPVVFCCVLVVKVPFSDESKVSTSLKLSSNPKPPCDLESKPAEEQTIVIFRARAVGYRQ